MVAMINGWTLCPNNHTLESRVFQRTWNVVHEVPDNADIQVHLPEYQLPTCISSQEELDLTEYKKAVKVYIDTPTPFKASVAQGINVTYTWSFDNQTDQVFHTDYLSCYSQCYESTAAYTFASLGIHTVMVNFSNTFGFTESSLSVIVVSKDIQNVTVTPRRQLLLLGERSELRFSVTTSSRYFTHIEIDMGDDSQLTRLSLVDRSISGADVSADDGQLQTYEQVRSSYGVGCAGLRPLHPVPGQGGNFQSYLVCLQQPDLLQLFTAYSVLSVPTYHGTQV
ncbi:PKD1L1 [Bugula neritina]|uniref:PKD1L1 n=1 Tax=Bugula neritina TaxID=10212 RepID=A0A7J7KAF8_BUGNE|nr:PKD1L1 [Bugula neritina]